MTGHRRTKAKGWKRHKGAKPPLRYEFTKSFFVVPDWHNYSNASTESAELSRASLNAARIAIASQRMPRVIARRYIDALGNATIYPEHDLIARSIFRNRP